MQDSLRWRCLWLVCLAAAASVSTKVVARTAVEVQGSEQCTVLDFTLEPSFYTLPNNLTVKPLSKWWHLKFQLSTNQSMHIACIRLEDRKSYIKLSMFSGDCKNGKNVDFGYLTSPMKLETWTTLGLRIIRDTVLVKEPQGGLVNLTGDGFTLPENGLWMTVTQAWGVETAVGCAVSCPVHYHNSAGTDIKNLVGEWKQESLYFHFRPRPSFKRLHYEVKCKTRQNKVFRQEVEIKPGEVDAAKNWSLVELRQRRSNATVRLNGKLLEAIQLPESCISSMHIIWTVGPGFFGFNCTPSGAEQTTKEKQTDETQSGAIMHPGAIVGITVFVTIVVQGVGLLVRQFIKKKSRPARYMCEDPQPFPRPGSSHSEIETTPIPKPAPQHTEEGTTPLPKPAPQHTEEGPTPFPKPAPQHTKEETTPLLKPKPRHTKGETTQLLIPAPTHAEGETTPLLNTSGETTTNQRSPSFSFHNGVEMMKHAEGETAPLPKPEPTHTERETTPFSKPALRNTVRKICHELPHEFKEEMRYRHKSVPSIIKGEICYNNPVSLNTWGRMTTRKRSLSFSFLNGVDRMKKLTQEKTNSEYDLLLDSMDDDWL